MVIIASQIGSAEENVWRITVQCLRFWDISTRTRKHELEKEYGNHKTINMRQTNDYIVLVVLVLVLALVLLLLLLSLLLLLLLVLVLVLVLLLLVLNRGGNLRGPRTTVQRRRIWHQSGRWTRYKECHTSIYIYIYIMLLVDYISLYYII